ncbi:hypothetical protein ABR33_19275 [Enterobacter bugandensis]|uniref:P2 family phage major capsid protein n=1 Tax=Enterobacter bugandensis TaxID=881260 RepID=UPI000642A58C|nr:P2 family phage major capsid protein [Enterobacter bugandensis]KLQ28319.1 hypothetical protein ABR33_19275 [Enterobacter bugandensis]
MQLTPKAEQMLRKYAAGLAKANGQADTSRFFSLTPPKETQLRDALLASSEFLRLLPNVLDVDQITGQVVTTGQVGTRANLLAEAANVMRNMLQQPRVGVHLI